MSQSLSATYLHLVFSTKNREPFLADPAIREHMHAFLAVTCQKLDCPVMIVGGVEDHVHILARFGREITQKDWVKELKRASSVWIKEQNPHLRKFYWQNGYAIFSVSSSKLDHVRRYIANQERHHKKQSFQNELRELLDKHKIEYDERYLWD